MRNLEIGDHGDNLLLLVRESKGDFSMRNLPFDRKDKLIKEKRHDAHPKRGNLPEATFCTECGAVYIKGRWSWEEKPEKTKKAICPACRRISSNYPAGYIEIKGNFYHEHYDEIQNLIFNIEKQEKEAHPLERVIKIEEGNDHTLVTTTGIHIARRIGESLARAYQGDLSFQYLDGEKRIRVYWKRE
jgi:NMD protein affecting ribosome stability and mRNA decay